MENVDRMIIDSLTNELQCSFIDSGEFRSLADLSSSQIIEGVVRCLWKCNPSTKLSISSYRLPGNAIDRFKMTTHISNEIESLGIRNLQIGYQALLYPNVFDSRCIFLALFERLPKETVKVDQKHLTPLEKLKNVVGESIAEQMAEHWVPEFCRFYDLRRIGRFWHPKKDNELLGAEGENICDDIWARLDEKFAEVEGKRTLEKPPPKIGPKPKLPPKPNLAESIRTREKEEEANKEKVGVTNCGRESDLLLLEFERLVAQKKEEIGMKRKRLVEIQFEFSTLAEEIQQKQNAAEGNDERLLALLEGDEAAENLEKLKNFFASADERRLALEKKFVEAKNERIARLEELEQSAGNARISHHLGIPICELQEAVEQKRRIRTKLLKELDKKPHTQKASLDGTAEGRKKVVQQIMEINSMVVKQNEQIRKTASSVQQIRREIDQLEGTLDRTFIAVDRWVGVSGNSNTAAPKMQRAYKLLIKTHEQCALVNSAIHSHGQLTRQIDELVDKVELETQKGVDAQLERMLDDLMLIRLENEELEARQRRGVISNEGMGEEKKVGV